MKETILAFIVAVILVAGASVILDTIQSYQVTQVVLDK